MAKKTPKALTARQAKFAAVFAGNGTEAARLAGYRGTDNTLAQVARENLRNPNIRQIIRDRQAVELEPLIASRQQRQEFWTEVLTDSTRDMRDRLKASELLGRSQADFTDNVKHSGGLTLEQLVVAAAAKKKPEGG